MASRSETRDLRAFLTDVVATYHSVVEQANLLAREREPLYAAINEFDRQRLNQIVERYSGSRGAADAGLTGAQLQAKIDITRSAAERLRGARGRPSVRSIRRWLKRAKVVVGSLKTLVPGAEALDELLDLLDATLDR